MLAKVRTEKGKTQEDLARDMGMSLGGIQYLEYSANSVKLDLLDQLCTVLDCEPGDLLKRVQDKTEEEARLKREQQRQEKSARMKQWWAQKRKEKKQNPQNAA
ncbi:MAG: helix-turn-helix domain-containing protein [Xenococcaceae cyanobacterium MO_234.B1]|nr:helix-turn-helix domain-containing protein [Xenococcaceae cyanobacterium MO_234.B1]